MSDRELAEHEWKLIAGVMEKAESSATRWNVETFENGGACLFYVPVGHTRYQFSPLHDHADLARFVEAMQAAGFYVRRDHETDGSTSTSIWLPECGDNADVEHDADTDLEATCFACVDALVEKEGRDGNTDG